MKQLLETGSKPLKGFLKEKLCKQLAKKKKIKPNKISTSKWALFFLILLISNAYGERYKSKFFDKKKNLSSNLTELKSIIPESSKMLDKLFSEKPVYTNVKVNVQVDEKVVQKIFNELDYTAKRSHRFTKIPYEVTKVNNFLFDVVQKPNLKGKVEILYNDIASKRFVYRITGTFDTFIIIRGEMLVDIVYTIKNNTVSLNARTYIVLNNKYIWESTKLFRIFSNLGQKIDKIIEYNIANIVKLGRKTAISIQLSPD